MGESADTKRCCRCNVVKPSSEFYRRTCSRDGLSGHCKACDLVARTAAPAKAKQRDARKRYYHSHKGKFQEKRKAYYATEKGKACRRRGRLQFYFGITVDQYEEMYARQEGLCAVCGRPEIRKDRSGKLSRLAVDHDHSTQAIRSLLCSYCNGLIGRIEKHPELLRGLVAYHRRHGQAQEA
jgi:hypothetical protein